MSRRARGNVEGCDPLVFDSEKKKLWYLSTYGRAGPWSNQADEAHKPAKNKQCFVTASSIASEATSKSKTHKRQTSQNNQAIKHSHRNNATKYNNKHKQQLNKLQQKTTQTHRRRTKPPNHIKIKHNITRTPVHPRALQHSSTLAPCSQGSVTRSLPLGWHPPMQCAGLSRPTRSATNKNM